MKKLVSTFLILNSLFLIPPLSHAENYSTVSKDFQFTNDLGFGFRGQDVENLQCILQIETPSGYFGPITKQAVIDLQNAHKDQILTPLGLTAGTGFVGEGTRNYLNSKLVTEGSTSTPSCPTYTAPPSQPQPISQPYPPTNPNINPNPISSLPNTNSPPPPPTNLPPPLATNANQQNQLGGLPLIPTLGNPYQNPYSPYGSVNGSPYNSFYQSTPGSFNSGDISSAASNLPQAIGDIAGLRKRNDYNVSQKYTEPLAEISTDQYGSVFIGGITTEFGGIGDRDFSAITGHDYSYDPLPIYPACNARGLDPNSNYMAFRWDYSATPASYLLTRYAEFYNPATNMYTLAKPVDYGPSRTNPQHASVDVSRGVLRDLRATAGSRIYFRLVPATGALTFGCNFVSH